MRTSSGSGRRAGRALALSLVLAMLVTGCGASSQPTAEGTAGEADGTVSPTEDSGESDAFYAGKTLNIVIPFGPGGGSDTGARFFAPYFNEEIAGNPSIQPVNVTGAGGIQGSNEWAQQMEKDGTNVLYTSGSNNFFYLYGDPRIEYDYAKMRACLGIPTGRPIVVSKEIADLSPAELAERDEPMVMAALGILGMDSLDLIAMEILGIPVNVVFGYDGSGAMHVAFEGGEVDAYTVTTTSYEANSAPMVEAGEAGVLLSHGVVEGGEIQPDPALPDAPTLPEVYEQIHGEPPSGVAFEAYKALIPAATTLQKTIWYHEEAPDEAVEACRTAAAELTEREDFQEEAAEVLGPYDLVLGEPLDEAIASVTSISDEARNWALDFLVETYDAPDPRDG